MRRRHGVRRHPTRQRSIGARRARVLVVEGRRATGRRCDPVGRTAAAGHALRRGSGALDPPASPASDAA
jgi:hypothetical protein